MKHKIFVFILFSFGRLLFPQANTYTFSGKITDDISGESLPGATILFIETGRGEVAGKNGEFIFRQIAEGHYVIKINYISYREIIDTIDIFSDLTINYSLTPSAIRLADIIIKEKYDKSGLEGSPQSITFITQEELDKHRGQTFGESLKRIAGVTVIQTGPSISKPVIRGLHSQRILLLNNGIRQEGQQWGTEHAPEIDPFIPSRIEVLKGSASLEYGADAIGGVIRIIPAELPEKTTIRGKLTLNGFSNNLQGSASGMVEGGFDFVSGLRYRLQGSLREAGDSRSPRFNISNSAFKERNGSLTLGLKKDFGSVEAFYSHFGTEIGIYSGAHIGNTTDLLRVIERGYPLVDQPFSYGIKPPKQEISHDLFSIKSKYLLSALGIVELDFGWQQNHRQEFDAHKFYNDSLAGEFLNRAAFDLTLTSYTLDLKLRHNPLNNFIGTIGINGIRQGNVSAGTSFLIPNFRVYGGGIFWKEEIILNGWSFNGGLRYDYRWMKIFDFRKREYVENLHTYNNITGAAGALFRFAEDWSIGINTGTAWRPPSINELYSDGVHHGTANYEIGNLSLDIEKSYNIDVTLRHQSNYIHAELSGYNYHFENYIHLIPAKDLTLTIRGAFPTFNYRQVDANITGFDGFVKYFINEDIWMQTNLSLVRGRDLNNNIPLIFLPSDRLSVLTHFHLPGLLLFEDNYLEFSSDLVSRQINYPAGIDFTVPPPGYVLFNITVGSALMIGSQSIKADFSLYNIFNKSYKEYLSKYRYFIDDPGLNMVLRLQIPFGNFNE